MRSKRRSVSYIYVPILFLTVIEALAFAGEIRGKTLKDIKMELLEKEVVIFGIKVYQALGNWDFAEEDSQGGYKMTYQSAPYSLKGSKGVVKFIGQSKRSRQKSSVNAFGEKVQDEDIIHPLIDIVVRLQDGRLVTHSGYYSDVNTLELELVSNLEIEKGKILKELDAMIGKVIYPVAYSHVFPPDADIDTMVDSKKRIFSKMDVPNLTPLTITKAKYLENEHAILFKVEFKNQNTGFIFADLIRKNIPANKGKTYFEKATSSFFRDIRKELKEMSDMEIQAIRKGAIFKGMSIDALYYSVGIPTKENDWGQGGKQLIYYDRIYVYIKNDKVVDMQSFSK